MWLIRDWYRAGRRWGGWKWYEAVVRWGENVRCEWCSGLREESGTVEWRPLFEVSYLRRRIENKQIHCCVNTTTTLGLDFGNGWLRKRTKRRESWHSDNEFLCNIWAELNVLLNVVVYTTYCIQLQPTNLFFETASRYNLYFSVVDSYLVCDRFRRRCLEWFYAVIDPWNLPLCFLKWYRTIRVPFW